MTTVHVKVQDFTWPQTWYEPTVAKKENLILECTNLHMALSKEVKHMDLEDGPWFWASTLGGESINPIL